jgi:hypothetical protein
MALPAAARMKASCVGSIRVKTTAAAPPTDSDRSILLKNSFPRHTGLCRRIRKWPKIRMKHTVWRTVRNCGRRSSETALPSARSNFSRFKALEFFSETTRGVFQQNRPTAAICDWPLSGRSVGSAAASYASQNAVLFTGSRSPIPDWHALRWKSVLAPILGQVPGLHQALTALGFEPPCVVASHQIGGSMSEEVR